MTATLRDSRGIVIPLFPVPDTGNAGEIHLPIAPPDGHLDPDSGCNGLFVREVIGSPLQELTIQMKKIS